MVKEIGKGDMVLHLHLSKKGGKSDEYVLGRFQCWQSKDIGEVSCIDGRVCQVYKRNMVKVKDGE